MARMEGHVKLIEQLKAMGVKARDEGNPSVIVGYTAEYAIFVHEMGGMVHSGEPRPSGLGEFWGPSFTGPKFLENPARELSDELGEIVLKAVRSGRSLAQAIVLAGLRLQRESMERVPVEFGLLRASAFTKLEFGGPEFDNSQNVPRVEDKPRGSFNSEEPT